MSQDDGQCILLHGVLDRDQWNASHHYTLKAPPGLPALPYAISLHAPASSDTCTLSLKNMPTAERLRYSLRSISLMNEYHKHPGLLLYGPDLQSPLLSLREDLSIPLSKPQTRQNASANQYWITLIKRDSNDRGELLRNGS